MLRLKQCRRKYKLVSDLDDVNRITCDSYFCILFSYNGLKNKLKTYYNM